MVFTFRKKPGERETFAVSNMPSVHAGHLGGGQGPKIFLGVIGYANHGRCGLNLPVQKRNRFIDASTLSHAIDGPLHYIEVETNYTVQLLHAWSRLQNRLNTMEDFDDNFAENKLLKKNTRDNKDQYLKPYHMRFKVWETSTKEVLEILQIGKPSHSHMKTCHSRKLYMTNVSKHQSCQ